MIKLSHIFIYIIHHLNVINLVKLLAFLMCKQLCENNWFLKPVKCYATYINFTHKIQLYKSYLKVQKQVTKMNEWLLRILNFYTKIR